MRRAINAARRALTVLFLVASVASACQEAGPPPPDATARAYAEAWERGEYREMWSLLTTESQERFGEAGFVERLPLIAREMSLVSLDATTGPATFGRSASGTPDPARATVPLSLSFKTSRVGDFSRETALRLVFIGEKAEGVWRIDWTPEAIVPSLTPGRLVRMSRVPTSRGRIIARDGTELATFVEATLVGVVTGQIQSEAGLLGSLSAALAMPQAEIKAKYTASWVRPDSFVPVKTVLDPAVRERVSLIEGVQTRVQRVRSYPAGLAAQTIGYVGEASEEDARRFAARGVLAGDVIGKAGLEANLEELIGGTFGWRLSIVEPNEQPVEMLAEAQPVPGLDAVLSLDAKMQRAAETALGEQRGAIVAEDPWSGEILALASRPTFDLNAFVVQDTAAIAKVNADPAKPVFNRATFGQYATGSSFKMVTASAALRQRLFSAGDLLPCPARWTGFGPQWVQLNHETGDLGMIDLRTALARSCNTFFYELGKRLDDKGRDLLPNAAKSFGFGRATDIEFVFEAEGIVPSAAWKAQAISDPGQKGWNPGDATNLAIGQGFFLATPLQMANYVAALANDGIVWQPRLVIALQDREGKVMRTFDKKEARRADATNFELSFVRDGMRAVVADPDGTVHFPFRGFQIAVAGKSGTAEISTTGRVNAWFVGFAPFDAPNVAIATVLEEFPESPGRHGSQDAATATRAVLAARFGTP